MTHTSRDANVLGACGLAVAGRLPSAAADAALVALHGWLAGGTVDALARTLRLSHSGAVRLADRLEADGLLERRAGADGRTRALFVTPAGAAAAGMLQAGRMGALGEVLGVLDDVERATLTGLLEKLLGAMVHDTEGARFTCRLCDADVCGHPETCPVTNAYVH
jgi:DNA-binding MarR family transcriptional regulator